jgi:N-acetyl-alpha-D-muramate 1-phosphate uridylyltransferase
MKISHAMVMAAGLGQRMRPLTLTRPKPLIKVAGRPLIARAIDALQQAGVASAVVNVHYLADQIESWSRTISSPRITISDERAALLDTGGALVKALPLLGADPFYVLNSDGFWRDDGEPALQRLAHFWRDDMDCLLLLSRQDKIIGPDGGGDFIIDGMGRLARAAKTDAAGVVYMGAYIVHPRLFAAAPSGTFSMNVLWDRAIAQGRLYGLVHDGVFFHVGTPSAIEAAEQLMQHRA